MLANVEKLIAPARKRLDNVQVDSPPALHSPLGIKRPTKPCKTFPVDEQIECAVKTTGSLLKEFSVH